LRRGAPARGMTAGVVFLDDERRILILKPTYRTGWLVPGGIVEPSESPRAACLRELREELALDAQADRLLCVEFESGTRAAWSVSTVCSWAGFCQRLSSRRSESTDAKSRPSSLSPMPKRW